MADINITNLEVGKGACDNLKSCIDNLNVLKSDTSAFKALASINPSMEGNFQEEYNNSLEDIYNFLNGNIYPAAVEYFKDDNSNGSQDTDHNNYSGGGGNIGGGNNNYYTPGGNDDAVPAVVNIPDVPDLDLDTGDIVDEELNKINKSSLEKMTLSDFAGMLNELVELAKLQNVTLDELLLNEKYSDIIKETLLASPFVPQEFKNAILELDSSKVRQIFLNILNIEYPEIVDINSLNLGITHSFLEKIADENHITVEDLLNKAEYQNLLKDSLSKYDNVIDLIKGWENLSSEDFQEQLKSFYLGDVPEEFPDEDILATRSFVDYLADECDVSYEEFLTDSSYADTLKDGAIEFGKSAKYFETLTYTSNEFMTETAKGIYDGKKYKSYGMSENDLSSFRSEIDNLAKSNNITSSQLLTNTNYSDLVKDTLQNSKSADGVGSIYQNSPSSVSQIVANNLYNSKNSNVKSTEKNDNFLNSILGK